MRFGKEPASRFVIAQSWWLASEVVRRNPELYLVETHPGGGMYDCLSVVTAQAKNLIDLNRVGRIHVHVNPDFEPITWSEVLASHSGHDAVHAIERAAGLTPRLAPRTITKTLTYRVIARVLTSLVDDRHSWDARNGRVDSSDGGGGRRAALEQFPTIVEAMRGPRVDDGGPTDAADRFWILLRDGEPLMVLDLESRLHIADKPIINLLSVYRESGSLLTPTIAAAIGHLLP